MADSLMGRAWDVLMILVLLSLVVALFERDHFASLKESGFSRLPAKRVGQRYPRWQVYFTRQLDPSLTARRKEEHGLEEGEQPHSPAAWESDRFLRQCVWIASW